MIIYGWNSKIIKQAPLENLVCENCQEKNSFLTLYSKYVHIFWIPFFPYKKEAQISCAQCQKIFDEKSMPADQKEKIKALKRSVPTPKYMYSGLFLLALAIGYFSYAGSQNKKKELTYLQEPQQGDVYKNYDETETTEFKYYLWKVTDVVGDSVYVSPSSYSYDGLPTKLEPEDGFYDAYFSVHKSLLKEMYDKGEIKTVLREYDPETGFDRLIAYPLLDSASTSQQVIN